MPSHTMRFPGNLSLSTASTSSLHFALTRSFCGLKYPSTVQFLHLLSNNSPNTPPHDVAFVSLLQNEFSCVSSSAAIEQSANMQKVVAFWNLTKQSLCWYPIYHVTQWHFALIFLHMLPKTISAKRSEDSIEFWFTKEPIGLQMLLLLWDLKILHNFIQLIIKEKMLKSKILFWKRNDDLLWGF